MSRKLLHIVASGALLALTGCALKARTDYDPKVSVASCHNYAFADSPAGHPESATAFGNPLNEKRLRDAISGNLSARGLTAVADAAGPDCTIGYAIGSRLAPDPGASRFSWGLGLGWGGWGRRGWGGSVGWEAPYDYREGRVTVDLFDARSRQALWHAYVDADVTGLTGADAEQRIKAVVAAIFEKFPSGVAAPAARPAAPATRS